MSHMWMSNTTHIQMIHVTHLWVHRASHIQCITSCITYTSHIKCIVAHGRYSASHRASHLHHTSHIHHIYHIHITYKVHCRAWHMQWISYKGIRSCIRCSWMTWICMSESCITYISCHTCEWVMTHRYEQVEWCHTCEWVMTHIFEHIYLTHLIHTYIHVL